MEEKDVIKLLLEQINDNVTELKNDYKTELGLTKENINNNIDGLKKDVEELKNKFIEFEKTHATKEYCKTKINSSIVKKQELSYKKLIAILGIINASIIGILELISKIV